MDITITGIPDVVTEQEIKEWVAIKVERELKAKLSVPKVDTDKLKTDVDAFRELNNLTPKYKAVEDDKLGETI